MKMLKKFVQSLKQVSNQGGEKKIIFFSFFFIEIVIFYRLNPITKVMEAYVSGREKTLRVTMTTALVIFMVSFTVP